MKQSMFSIATEAYAVENGLAEVKSTSKIHQKEHKKAGICEMIVPKLLDYMLYGIAKGED